MIDEEALKKLLEVKALVLEAIAKNNGYISERELLACTGGFLSIQRVRDLLAEHADLNLVKKIVNRAGRKGSLGVYIPEGQRFDSRQHAGKDLKRRKLDRHIK